MSEYTFPVQFTFSIDLTYEGETIEEATDKLEKQASERQVRNPVHICLH